MANINEFGHSQKWSKGYLLIAIKKSCMLVHFKLKIGYSVVVNSKHNYVHCDFIHQYLSDLHFIKVKSCFSRKI